jgi:hypothetical protein
MKSSGYGRQNVPMRQGASKSYDPVTGRPASSLAGQNNQGSPSTTHASPSSQIEAAGAFHGIDRTRTQIRTPVKNRRYLDVHEG